MRWVSFELDDGNTGAGLVVDESVHVPEGAPSLLSLLGDDGERLAVAGEAARTAPIRVLPLAGLRLLSPVPQPPTVRDFYAFEQHVKTARQRRGLDMIPEWYELPVFYFSNPYAVGGDREAIAIPPGSAELDYELEVAAIIGLPGADIRADAAERHIAGYCVMNDWSARDLQRREMTLNMGPVKGKDFATTLGPMLVTLDELDDRRSGKSFDLAMTARVNGVEYSRASLADIHYSFAEMIEYASRGTRVATGDVIGSGTCGTGCILELSLVHGRERFPWLAPGDEVEVEVERLGTLHNRIAAGPR
jgi:2-keto-4-pentenoate hydratase/2-oxohepta-3-ene-1,7-dioic acid hydratase in catechol pathway